jgi:uncharacterized membrane protein YccC
MTRAETLARAKAAIREQLEADQQRLKQILASEREEARKARTKRRMAVGTLADDAGLLDWEDATLRQLFALLARLKDAPHPVAVLEGVLADGAVGTNGSAERDGTNSVQSISEILLAQDGEHR